MKKKNYYLDIAETVAKNARCLRRNYGAIIVKNDEIVSTGYNGAPRGCTNCTTIKSCQRITLNISHGTQYEKCRAVHAEQNCIISSSRKEMIGSTLYLVGKEFDTNEYVNDIDCCILCKRLIINSGITNVIMRIDIDSYKEILVNDWLSEL